MRSHYRHRYQPLLEALEERAVPTVIHAIQVLNTLGTAAPAPAPGFVINDFEADGVNNHGDVLYGADLGTANDPSTFYGEGIFLKKSGGPAKPIAFEGSPAPSTGTTYGPGFFGPAALNDNGDAAFAFSLNPPGAPNGVNGGAFRYSAVNQKVTAIVVPGVTKIPGGGATFAGVDFSAAINEDAKIVFPGIVATSTYGIGDTGLSDGLYESLPSGKLVTLVSPGDKAPGGGRIDYASNPTINENGDVAFSGHLAGEPFQLPIFPPPSVDIFPYKSLYVRDGGSGKIKSIAHIGDAAPGGGNFSQCLFPDINNKGDVLFTGDLSPASDPNQTVGVFLYKASSGKIIPIARPGDAMPGGGTMLSASVIGSVYDLNNSGTVLFSCVLSTDVDHNGTHDTGEFEWSNGHVSLIARTGTNIPGIGTVQDLFPPAFIATPPPNVITPFGGVINDKGQVLFNALFMDGSDRLLLDTPFHVSFASGPDIYVVLPSLTSLSLSKDGFGFSASTGPLTALPATTIPSAASASGGTTASFTGPSLSATDSVFAALWQDLLGLNI